jgi:hypothetical protein
VLEEADLTPVERALCEAAVGGSLLDRRTRRSVEDNPARGRTWGNDRQIRAQLLRQLLTGQGPLDQTFGSPLAVRLRGVQITGRLNLGGLTLRCPLELYDCFLGGQLDLAKAKAPDISLRGSYLCQRLSARQLHLDHNLNLSDRFHCHGAVKLVGAHIGGQLNCQGATFTNPDGTALNADGLKVDGYLFLRRARVTGEVWLLGAHIGGQLACEQATFTNPDGTAITADGLKVDGHLLLRSARVTGEARLLGAHIGGQLNCQEATFTNPDGTALNLERVSVTEAALIRPAGLEGRINLTDARVGGWYDDQQTWPAALDLEGFVYETIHAPNDTPRKRLDWLRRHQGYVPQPYEQLAAVYRRAGDHQGARTVAIAKQQARRAQVRRWWARWPSRAWSGVLRWTIGYGYRPALALPYLVGLLAVGWVVFDQAYPTHLSPAKTGPEQAGFHPARYTLDLLLPVANLKQRDAFVPHGYAAWWAFGLSLAGWLLAAVVVAGFTGIFKRD